MKSGLVKSVLDMFIPFFRTYDILHFLFQVERVASMLNYFLLQLVGPQRKSLSLKDPEKYEFRPKQLLRQVCYWFAQLSVLVEANLYL